MSFNGSGSFLINTAGQPVVSGTVISSTAFNALTADLATGLSTCITKDGQTTVTANIPMANYKFTGLGAGSGAADSANLSQVQSTVVKLLASVSGTDTITAVGSPTVAAYAAGQMFYFVAAGDNTGAVTINIDSLGAKAVTRDGSVALAAGDIKSGEVVVIVYDGTRFQVVSQLNSSGDARFANVSIASALNVGGVATVTGGSVLNGGVVINEPGADVDFRVESDTDANCLFVDASANNVGIGTSSPGAKLHVEASSSSEIDIARLRVINGASGIFLDIGGDEPNKLITFDASGAAACSYVYRSGGAEVMRLNTSGNLGLGVTPPAWWSGGKAMHLNVGAFILGSSTQQVLVGTNFYYDGSNNKYIGNGEASYYEQNASIHKWYTAPSGTAGNTVTFTQAMTLDANGTLTVKGTGSGNGNLIFDDPGTAIVSAQGTAGSELILNGRSLIKFTTGGTPTGTERARITSGGYSKFSDNGTYVSSTGAYHEMYQSANNKGLRVYCADSSAYNEDVLYVQGARTTTNATYNVIYATNGNGTGICLIRDSGNVLNTNNSYGQLSDVKTKQDIVDAASQWDDIKSVRVRKFRFKNNPDGALQIGVVAQELEAVSPGLVEEAPDRDDEGNDLGTTTKSVKYSVLYMKAVKALQEAMARIEKLEAEVAALKGA